jgi:hypothetical protein
MRMGRWLVILLMSTYCVAILLLLDLVYSNFLHADGPAVRTPDPRFDHGLAANFDGYDVWGTHRYRLYTNSLGFKDAAVRQIPLSSARRRIVLIGDSFTEAIGLTFEDSFAGQLFNAGMRHSPQIEFLNAAVASYSPVIYYRKLKFLLESGLQFDEVVVFSDISDVGDEATSYFCFDEDPEYQSYCREQERPRYVDRGTRRTFLERNFSVIDATILWTKLKIRSLRQQELGPALLQQVIKIPRSGWTIPGFPVAKAFVPLGIEGGIKRSVKNMQALADLLTKHSIPLTVVVYPWPTQLAYGDLNSRQVALWREFCLTHCKSFIDLFPVLFEAKNRNADWYERLFVQGDAHFSPEGNALIYRELVGHLLN